MKGSGRLEKLIYTTSNLRKHMHLYMHKNRSDFFNKEIALHIIAKRSKNGVLPLIELRQDMHLAPSTITSILTYLENQGFIERIIDLNDRRNISIKVTDKGYEHLSQNRKDLNKEFEKYINYMGEEDVDKLIDILEKTIIFLKGGNN